jgi:mannosyltransferase OCH1-like enzyme
MSIPKLIHQIWVGPNPIPSKSTVFIEGIRKLHPEFTYRLWTNEDITPENFVNYAFIVRAKSYAQKADIMRYEILYRHGGVYFDIDFEVFKNITPLLNNDLVVCNEDANIDKYMTNAFICASKENAELLKCIQLIKTIDFSSNYISKASGPWFFRKCINLTDKVSVLPTSYVYPTHYSNKRAAFTIGDTTYACHHWDKNW